MMGIFSSLASMFGRGEPQNAVEFTPDLWAAIQANGSNAISWRKAIEVAAVLAGARIYGNGLAADPWKIMQVKENGDRVEGIDHPYYNLITYRPNEYQTSFEFRQTLGFNLALSGNAYVWLDRVGPRQNKIVNLLPLDPSWVTVGRSDNDWGEIKYRVSFPDGTSIETSPKFVWHLRNMAWDGYCGISALSYARDAINLSKDVSNSQADSHRNQARPSGVLAIDQVMEKGQFKQVRALIDAQVQTRLSKGYPMVVDKTMTWTQMATKAVDMQSVETRKQIAEEILIHMGILPAIAGFSGDGSQSYASVEQLEIRGNNHFRRPLHENFTQSADRWLFTDEDRRNKYYNRLVDQAILRADTKARADYYRQMIASGIMTRNEARAMEDMNTKPGGDYTWMPLANAPVGDDGMHIIQENDSLDNNLRSGGDSNDIASLFLRSTPQQKARFAALFRTYQEPEEGGTL